LWYVGLSANDNRAELVVRIPAGVTPDSEHGPSNQSLVRRKDLHQPLRVPRNIRPAPPKGRLAGPCGSTHLPMMGRVPRAGWSVVPIPGHAVHVHSFVHSWGCPDGVASYLSESHLVRPAAGSGETRCRVPPGTGSAELVPCSNSSNPTHSGVPAARRQDSTYSNCESSDIMVENRISYITQ
jgi:hypothetical protein